MERQQRGLLVDESALLRVGHRLKAGVCAKLAVDVVEVVAECLAEMLSLRAMVVELRPAAQRLSLSVKTVERHRADLMRRLEIHDIAGLVRWAIGHGLVTFEL